MSDAAIARLHTRLREVAAGRVVLNHERDEQTFPKEYGVKLYGLDAIPLLQIFQHRDADDGEAQP